MNRFIVDSTLIFSIGYIPEILAVEFRDGGLYEYLDVPEEIFHELTVAKSVGAYFVRNIKDRYQYRKIR